jgi:hypothetical protein
MAVPGADVAVRDASIAVADGDPAVADRKRAVPSPSGDSSTPRPGRRHARPFVAHRRLFVDCEVPAGRTAPMIQPQQDHPPGPTMRHRHFGRLAGHRFHRRHGDLPALLVGSLQGHRLRRRLVFGGGLVIAGVVWLLERHGALAPDELWLIAPAVLAWSAAVRLAIRPSALSVAGAVVRLALAAYLTAVIEHLGGWTFAQTWPVLLIGYGLAQVAGALAWRTCTRSAGDASEEPTW